MRKIFSIALFVAVCAFTSQAQEKTQPSHEKHKAKKESKKSVRQELDLTADQRKEMKSINMEFKNEVKAVRDDKSLNEDQKKQQIKSLHAKRQQTVKAILTTEQQQKLVQHKKPRKKHKRGTSIK